MKCPKCGNEISNGRSSCPNCKGVVSETTQSIVMETTAQPIQKKKKTSIWKIILGILFFPIALTIIIAKNKKMKPIMKIVLIVILWVFVLVVGASNSDESTPSNDNNISDSSYEEKVSESQNNETTGQTQNNGAETPTPYRIINDYCYRLKQVFGDAMPTVEQGRYENNFLLNFDDFTLLVFVNILDEDPTVMNLQLTGTETDNKEYMLWVKSIFTALLGNMSEDEFAEMMNFAKASPMDQLGRPSFTGAISPVTDILYYETAATSTTITYTIKAEYTE